MLTWRLLAMRQIQERKGAAPALFEVSSLTCRTLLRPPVILHMDGTTRAIGQDPGMEGDNRTNAIRVAFLLSSPLIFLFLGPVPSKGKTA